MTDIKIISDQGEEVQHEEQPDINEPKNRVSPENELLYYKVSQMFNIEPKSVGEYQDKIKTLIEYAKMQTEDHSAENLKWELRNLGIKLGTPPLGEKLINYLHNYVRIWMDGKRIEEQKARFLRNGN